jgi:integrase
MSVTRYQEGSIERVRRSKGPAVWVLRYRQDVDGKRVHRSRVLGTVKEFKSKADAKRASENLRAEINAAEDRAGRMTVEGAWGHFQANELEDPGSDRSPTTIATYRDYFKQYIIPHWRDVAVDDVKAVAVEKWLRSLPYADATKAKIRNHLSALFSHLIRWELHSRLNPIASVRQGSGRRRDPDVLTLSEMSAILSRIVPLAIRVMVVVAATTALRRSEFRGLRWSDVDFDSLWLHLRRGVVRMDQTKLKTLASRKGVPMIPELADALLEWRHRTPYPTDDDWVFASPFTNGKRPYWPDSALQDHLQPAAVAAGINKRVGWHTFRHSLATLLGHQKEDVKTVQELLRHTNSRITLEVYQQAGGEQKRNALSSMSGLFLPAAGNGAD